jgi:hypothetical protein
MCCFSQPVELVADTSIFARACNSRQYLVYSMSYTAVTDLAMVLPLPVPPRPPEDAVRFINLQRYPNFFDDMRRGFPPRMVFLRSWGAKPIALDAPKLPVHDVGNFEASFVPCIEDFERLDERFRIPRQVWDRLPAYQDFGFAVFKLKRSPRQLLGRVRKLLGGSERKPKRVHPMAFEFPRRNPDLLYFPTLHVHDGIVHTQASFDHMLYCQAEPEMKEYLAGWEPSSGPASRFMNTDRTEGMVAAERPCWRLPLAGRLENKDALVGKGGAVPVFWRG